MNLQSKADENQSLPSFLEELKKQNDYRWAWANYLDVVRQIIDVTAAKRVIEIGGGRDPALTEEDVRRSGIDYYSNDILQEELERAPAWVEPALFDVQTPDPAQIRPFADQFDVAFSRMVMEHVENYERAYRNIHTLLREGGVGIAFHPIYFAFPFLANTALPETLSKPVLEKLFAIRNDEGTPKFPAHYSGCRISSKVRENIQSLGFSRVIQVPFYGHSYYKKFLLIREAHRGASKAFARTGFSPLAAYAFTIVVK